MKVKKVRAILSGAIVVLLVIGYGEARKSSGQKSSGWGLLRSRSSSRTTARPRPQSTQTGHQQQSQGGSTPDKIGWNVPDPHPKASGGSIGAKPSAPQPDISKSSATSLQSGYSPSGGYPKQPASNPYASQTGSNPYSGGQGYHAPAGGYNPPSGGYHAPGGGYNPPAGGYNPPVGGYNPPVGGYATHGQSYGSPMGASYGQPSYSPSYGQPHNVPMGGGFGQQPQQTVVLQPAQSYKAPGVGQLAKEAFVYAGVSAGVNAAVNRIIPGGIYGTRGTGGGGGGGGGEGSGGAGASHTQITYNNYYNNGSAMPQPADPGANAAAPVQASGQPAAPAPAPVVGIPAAGAPAAPAAPAPAAPVPESAQAAQQANPANAPPPRTDDPAQQNNPSPLGYAIPNDDMKKLSEDLYSKDANNANKHVTMNLQGQKKDDSVTDDAPEPLLTVKSEAYDGPTIKAVLALHDNYQLNVDTKETVTSEERREEDELLDKFLQTEVMKAAMKFLSDKGYIPNDEYEFKDSLKRIWFSQFKRVDGEPSSSGFEAVYLAEQFGSDIIGLHNWIYYATQEATNKINYLGYIKEAKLGDKGAIVKLRSSLNGIVQPVTTIFVGTSPELEMALYTICFYTRPNDVCPMSLGGTEFMIIANRVNYFGKDIMISAYPDI